jgi:hypothetical protein
MKGYDIARLCHILNEIGDTTRFDYSSPGQSGLLFILPAKNMWWSAKIGRGWSGIPIFP